MGSPYASKNGNGNFGSFHLKRTEYEDSEEAIRNYQNHIEEYTMRDMTKNSDILNAFKGLEAVMKRAMNTEFWYGLPESQLDLALLWTLSGAHNAKECVSERVREILFPKLDMGWMG